MRKLQDLENSISCRWATFGKFQIFGKICKIQDLEARFGKFQILPARLENSRSCGKIWKIPDLAGKIWKVQDLAADTS